jgi:hypothetical protein
MPAIQHVLDDADLDDRTAVLGPVDARREDAYWQRAFWLERYYRQGLDYEDYAPAYCVGYIGYAQYGGAYDDAEKSLCANWERIKGDSRLSLDGARLAMRAAWNRMAGRGARDAVRKAVVAKMLRQRLKGRRPGPVRTARVEPAAGNPWA